MKEGFPYWEAKSIVKTKTPLYDPALKELRKERKQSLHEARKAGKGKRSYAQQIVKEYRAEGLVRKQKLDVRKKLRLYRAKPHVIEAIAHLEVKRKIKASYKRKLKRLERRGFFTWEAKPLDKISFKTPYVRDLIQNRRAMLKQALADKITLLQFQAQVKQQYYSKGWLDKQGNPSFWAMLRWYAKKGEEKYPDWKTPHPKKPIAAKDYQTFEAKWEATGQKYPPRYGNKQ